MALGAIRAGFIGGGITRCVLPSYPGEVPVKVCQRGGSGVLSPEGEIAAQGETSPTQKT